MCCAGVRPAVCVTQRAGRKFDVAAGHGKGLMPDRWRTKESLGAGLRREDAGGTNPHFFVPGNPASQYEGSHVSAGARARQHQFPQQRAEIERVAAASRAGDHESTLSRATMMSDVSINPPTRQALAVKGRSGRLKVTGRLRVALNAMIWDGKKPADAAHTSGLADRSLRAALAKPHVRQYILAAARAIRNGEFIANLRTLIDVRDNSENDMARIAAVKELRAMDENEAKSGTSDGSMPVAPGLVIQVIGRAEISDGQRPNVINVTPEPDPPPRRAAPLPPQPPRLANEGSQFRRSEARPSAWPAHDPIFGND